MSKDTLNLKDPEIFFSELKNLSEDELLAFVSDWHKSGESAVEIKNFVDYIYKQEAQIDTGFDIYDCCGTGGDGASTFNISTTAAIVAAGSGAKIAKHGGRSTTSKSGSVDVLEALGLNLDSSLEKRLSTLKENNLAFFASKVTGELLAPVKQLLKKNKQTGFISLLAPLASPVKLSGQLIGAGNVKWSDVIADVLAMQGRKKAMVVYSGSPDGKYRLDEISAVSLTRIIDIEIPEGRAIDPENFQADLDKKIEDEDIKFKPRIFSPEDIRLPLGKIEELEGGDAKTNAQIIWDILDYAPKAQGTKINAVCLNSAALLEISGLAKDIKEGYEISLEAIKSGKVKSNFEDFLIAQR